MKHTRGKWTALRLDYQRNVRGRIELCVVAPLDENGVSFSPIGELYKHPEDENIAKDTVQMHNSFDGLLKACKEVLEVLKAYNSYEASVHKFKNSIPTLESAIKKAENNN